MTTPWDGRGLPPVAQLRVERAARSRLATSLLSAPAAAAARLADLVPVGEAFGAVVVHLGWAGFGDCGWVSPRYGGFGLAMPSGLTGRYGGLSGFQPLVRATRAAYASALDRLAAEAAALGADGVVGIRIDLAPMGNDNVEFTALGTAVRFTTGAPPQRAPFRTELSAVDVLALLRAGWLPTDVLFGIGIEIVHDDWNQLLQTSSFFNNEVTNLTRLMAGARHEARSFLQAEAVAAGAEGVLLTTRQERVWEQEPADQHRDHVAEVRLRGTGLVRSGMPTHRPTLTVLPVRP